MEPVQGFALFQRGEAPRLRLLVGLMVDEPLRRDMALTQCWLIARHRWSELARRPRPDLWLLALTLRTLRRPVAPVIAQPVRQVETSLPGDDSAAVVAGLLALDPPLRLVVVLRHILGLTLDEIPDVVDLPAQLVRDQLRQGLRGVEDHLDERPTG